MSSDLKKLLESNGYSRNENITLDQIIANTMQDGQYSAGAYQSAQALAKYSEKYGNMTVKEIKTLQ